jgi:hypothetical protein
MNKKSDHIRIRPEDKKVWGEYCKALGTPSPDLFSKIIKSPELKLNERILAELKKQEEDLKRKLRLK